MLRKSQPNFQDYVKKIEAQPKNGFLIKKRKLISAQQNLLVAIENI